MVTYYRERQTVGTQINVQSQDGNVEQKIKNLTMGQIWQMRAITVNQAAIKLVFLSTSHKTSISDTHYETRYAQRKRYSTCIWTD